MPRTAAMLWTVVSFACMVAMSLWRRTGTELVRTWDLHNYAAFFAKPYFVENEGRVRDAGAPEAIYPRPKSEFSAAFMGEANLVAATVREFGERSIELDTGLGIVQLPASAWWDDYYRPLQYRD